MLSPNHFNNPERSGKVVAPLSPQAKRKNLDFAVHTPIPTPNVDYPRKQINGVALSPPNHYYPKVSDKSMNYSRETDSNFESFVRQLSQKITKMSGKLTQHQSILLKITEQSIQTNKDSYKRTHQPNFSKLTQPITENINRLRREFEEYKTSAIVGKESETSNHLVTELIHKSEERMRQETRCAIKQEQLSGGGSRFDEDRVDDLERSIKRLEKGMAVNSGKITDSYERIDSISSSIDGHMDLINAEVNKAIAKIVNFVNEKVSKPFTESLEQITQRIDILQIESRAHSPTLSHFGGLKSSNIKSHKEMTRAEYRQSLTAYGQQIIISESTYYIDSDGHLLDREFFYLIHNDERIRLDERQIKMLMNERLLD